LKIKAKDEICIVVVHRKLESIQAQNMELDILFEDQNILILNKDAGINVHPVPGEF
jgi:23S rRNA pseudouridine1911/1915/1917 synthase